MPNKITFNSELNDSYSCSYTGEYLSVENPHIYWFYIQHEVTTDFQNCQTNSDLINSTKVYNNKTAKGT